MTTKTTCGIIKEYYLRGDKEPSYKIGIYIENHEGLVLAHGEMHSIDRSVLERLQTEINKD